MNRLSSSRRIFTVTLFTSLFSPPATLPAGTTRPAAELPSPALPEAVEPAGLDQLWQRATLYQDRRNPILQELKLRGRYHGQYHWLESAQGEDDGWEDRRSRLGIDAKLFNQLRVDRATGAVAEGRTGRFSYQAGAYANDVDREFGRLEGGVSFGAGTGWDFKDSLGATGRTA